MNYGYSILGVSDFRCGVIILFLFYNDDIKLTKCSGLVNIT